MCIATFETRLIYSEPRTVVVGFQQDDLAIIISGLKAGERVVVKGGVILND